MKEKRLLKSLAFQSKTEESVTESFWTLDVLDNAFRFALSDSDTEWFVEYDKLVSVNAYKGLRPLDMKETLEHLEKLSPGYLHITAAAQLYLIRTRMQDSPGILLRWKEKDVLWLGDPHLTKLNFLDFYQKELFPKTGKSTVLPPIDNVLNIKKEEEGENGKTIIN